MCPYVFVSALGSYEMGAINYKAIINTQNFETKGNNHSRIVDLVSSARFPSLHSVVRMDLHMSMVVRLVSESKLTTGRALDLGRNEIFVGVPSLKFHGDANCDAFECSCAQLNDVALFRQRCN